MKVPSPVRGVPGTLYSPRFIARLICDKFRLSLPLYWQFAVLRAEGLDMSRSTLTRLLHKHVDTMAPIVERLWTYNKLAEYLACDESPIRTKFKGVSAKMLFFPVLLVGKVEGSLHFPVSLGLACAGAE
ncbi:MAG: transposase [Oligoflexales bacterium]